MITEEEQADHIHTSTVIKGQFVGNLYIMDDGNIGAAFMKSSRGPIEFVRGPVSWNATNDYMLDKLCAHMSLHQSTTLRSGYELNSNGMVMYYFSRGGRTSRIGPQHPFHPDYGRYVREMYADCLSSGGQAPYYDTFRSENSDDENELLPDAPYVSYIELQTIDAARIAFRRIHTRRAQQSVFSVNLRVSGTIGGQDEQDNSMDESIDSQNEDTSNRS